MLYFDIDQRALVRAPGSDQWLTQARGKRGDTLPLSVTILRGATVEELASVTEMVFCVKLALDDADPLVLANDFTEAAGVWTSPLAMNTEEIDEALGVAEKIDLIAEFSFTSTLGTISSQIIAFPLYRDLWLGSEGTPLSLPTPDEWLDARAIRIDKAEAASAAEKRQHWENLGFTAYADLTAANTALPIGTLFYNIATATLAITTA